MSKKYVIRNNVKCVVRNNDNSSPSVQERVHHIKSFPLPARNDQHKDVFTKGDVCGFGALTTDSLFVARPQDPWKAKRVRRLQNYLFLFPARKDHTKRVIRKGDGVVLGPPGRQLAFSEARRPQGRVARQRPCRLTAKVSESPPVSCNSAQRH